ncbi:MAG: VWA domain-containing protein [Deltaproteobacteria bacterium]|nr:VWA domain-containing protein [Deltaproteobacteria bacterium]
MRGERTFLSSGTHVEWQHSRLQLVYLICVMILLWGYPGSSDAQVSPSERDIEIIMDASGSMRGKAGGRTKIEAAREALAAFLEEIPEGTYVAFRAYGHGSPRQDRNCQDTELLVPLSPVNKSKIMKEARALKARGYTPIAYSLRKAMKDFRDNKAVGSAIVLIRHGEETCEGDPCAMAKELDYSGYDLVVHAVGFDVDPKARKQLECVAHATGGSYREARDASQLTASLKLLAREEIFKPRVNKMRAPGAWFHDAPLVGEGKYREELDVRDVHFYKIQVRQGQKVQVSGAIKKTRMNVPEGANKIPFAVRIYNADFNEVTAVTLSVSGNPSEPNPFQIVWYAPRSGEAYISISSSYDNERWADEPWVFGTRPAPSQYTLTVKLPGERRGSSTAPSGLSAMGKPRSLNGSSGYSKAPSLEPGIYLSNVLMGETNYYRVPVKKGEKVDIVAVVKKPRLRAPAVYDLKIIDEEKVEVARPEEPMSYIAGTPAEPGVFRARWSSDYEGVVYISFGVRDDRNVPQGAKKRSHEYALIINVLP